MFGGGGFGGSGGSGSVDPFQMMDQMMSSMLSGFPHHGVGLLGGPGFGHDPRRLNHLLTHEDAFGRNRHSDRHSARERHGGYDRHAAHPSVEEIHHHGNQHEHLPRSGSVPIVEEPDDDPRRARGAAQNGRHPGMGSTMQAQQPGFYSYSSSTTVRQGPGGVYEARHREEDSTGRQRLGVARGVGDRSKAVIREKVGTQERTYNKLHGLAEDDVGQFDREWEDRAAQMPRVSYDHRAPYDNRAQVAPVSHRIQN